MSVDDSPASVAERQLPGWTERAGRLADDLATGGSADPRWLAAVRCTPRHVLVPSWYVQDDRADWRHVTSGGPTRAEWADGVYADSPLVTALDHDEPTSSSSKPGLMVRMLEALDVHYGHRVLEIGTGTGYNAALLAHRLSDRQVYSVDIDPDLVATARDRLASLDTHPAIATRDGATGWPAHAPYDRIIATCSVPRVPWAWAEQLVPGGCLLVDVKIGTGFGTLALLRRTATGLTGRFLAKWAGFMTIRSPATAAHTVSAPRLGPFHHASGRIADLAAHLSSPLNPVEEFLAALDLPDNHLHHTTILDPTTLAPAADHYTSADGSWCEILRAPHPGAARVGGPTPLLDHLVSARSRWQSWNRPGWDAFRLDVTPTEHRISFDGANGGATWSLPTAPSEATG